MAVYQPYPLNSRPIVCFSLASLFFWSNLVSSAFPFPCISLTFYFYFSPIFPISSFVLLVFPFSGLLVTFPVLCDCPCQMLPITVRNMPSISPLILKRLKVQFSLPPPPTCGCQPLPSVNKSQPIFSLSLLNSATGCYCSIINAWFSFITLLHCLTRHAV